jgi:hypothetical protein
MVILGLVIKDGPWAYLQPELSGLSVLVHNMAKESILIKSFKCEPVSMFVGRSHETRDIAEAQAAVPPITVIAPQSKHSFSVLTMEGWDELVPDSKVVIAMCWSLTRSRWLPQFPTRIRKTVGFVNAVMRLTPSQAASSWIGWNKDGFDA